MNSSQTLPATSLAVTHAVLSLDCGGLERVVVDLVRTGVARGQRLSVICLERRGMLASQVEDLGVRLVCLEKPPGLHRETKQRAIDALQELRPDVVHTHQIGALLYVGSAARRAGIAAIAHTEHGNHIRGKNWSRRMRHRALWAWAGRFARRFFCVSEEIAQEVRRYGVVPARKIQVLANGINTTAFLPGPEANSVRDTLAIPHTASVIGTVGRLHEVKCQDLLIRAFARVHKRFPDSHLLLVGDGPERNSLERLVGSSGLTSVVHFAGYQSRPERFLPAMDVFALTSRSEGMPLSVLEAWAAGRPVVASAVGGLPAIIEEGKTGLLFPSGDEDALVGVLSSLLTDKRTAWRMGQSGQAFVQREFSLEKMATDYERQYRRILQRVSIPATA